MTIGERVYQAVHDRAREKGTSFQDECIALDVGRNTIHNMRKNKTNPGSWLIAELLRQGYDIEWILLGGEEAHGA